MAKICKKWHKKSNYCIKKCCVMQHLCNFVVFYNIFNMCNTFTIVKLFTEQPEIDLCYLCNKINSFSIFDFVTTIKKDVSGDYVLVCKGDIKAVLCEYIIPFSSDKFNVKVIKQ